MNTMPKKDIDFGVIGSDSSMVDEYQGLQAVPLTGFEFRFLYGRWIPREMMNQYPMYRVQIPLWSMNTYQELDIDRYEIGSDSSMVDEYEGDC